MLAVFRSTTTATDCTYPPKTLDARSLISAKPGIVRLCGRVWLLWETPGGLCVLSGADYRPMPWFSRCNAGFGKLLMC